MSESTLLGSRLGRFLIQAELGRGGMAVVYRAHQPDLARDVALKVLRPELAVDQNYVARFTQEARSVAALEHPHIVPIYEVGSAAPEGSELTLHYLVMKYLSGTTLKQVVHRRGPLDLHQTAYILEQVAGAIDYAHRQGIIHRDIKPSNIMVTDDGWAYLMDFGLARSLISTGGLTIDGAVMGTPEYMSPEQAEGRLSVGQATDIYSLGVVMYELLTGRMPFEAETPLGALVARLQRPPAPMRTYRGDLPQPVEEVMLRALARDPAARFATAGEMVAALRRAAQAEVRAGAGADTPDLRLAVPAAADSETIYAPAPALAVASPSPAALVAEGATIALAQPAGLAAPPAAAPPGARPGVNPRSLKRRRIVAAAVVLVVGLGAIFGRDDRPFPHQIERELEAGADAIQRAGQLDRAAEAYRRVLAMDPGNVSAHTQLALVAYLRGDAPAAQASAQTALASEPDNAKAQALLAQALLDQGDLSGGLAAADKSVALDGDLAAGYAARALARSALAVESADSDLLSQADSDSDKAVSLAEHGDPLGQAVANAARGTVCWQSYVLHHDQQDVDCSRDAYEQARRLQSQLAIFPTYLGMFYEAQGNHTQAQQLLLQAATTDPGYSPAHTGLGWNRYYLKDYSGALDEFDRALKLNPNDTDAYIGRSSVYQERQPADYKQAIGELSRAASLAPRRALIFYYLGRAHRDYGLRLPSGSPEQLQSFSSAEKQYQQALSLNSRYVDALTGLGWVHQDMAAAKGSQELFETSLENFRASLDLREEQPEAHNGAGWSFLGLKQYEDAEMAFRRAIELKDDYANAYFGLGQAQQASGRLGEARESYRKAIERGSIPAQEALSKLK
jgi:serine/threonine-protein kinase